MNLCGNRAWTAFRLGLKGRLSRCYSKQDKSIETRKDLAIMRRIDSLKCSPQHIEIMDLQIRDLANLEDYDGLVDTYKQDILALHTDPFSNKLDVRRELIKFRYLSDKQEKFVYRSYTAFAIILLGAGISIFSVIYYNWDRTKIRMPTAVRLFWKLRLLPSEITLLSSSEVQSKAALLLDVVEDYIQADKQHSLKNSYADLRILNVLAQMDLKDSTSERYCQTLKHILQDLIAHHKLYQPHIEPRELFESIRGIIRRVSKFSKTHPYEQSTELVCMQLETLMLYLRDSTFTDEKEVILRMEVLHMFATLKQQNILKISQITDNASSALKKLEWERSRFGTGLVRESSPPRSTVLTQSVKNYLLKTLLLA
jgi:hypothetical protein